MVCSAIHAFLLVNHFRTPCDNPRFLVVLARPRQKPQRELSTHARSHEPGLTCQDISRILGLPTQMWRFQSEGTGSPRCCRSLLRHPRRLAAAMFPFVCSGTGTPPSVVAGMMEIFIALCDCIAAVSDQCCANHVACSIRVQEGDAVADFLHL